MIEEANSTLFENKEKFLFADKILTLYKTEKACAPLIILNNFYGDGESVVKELNNMECTDFNLLSVGNLEWNDEMTPWYCPPIQAGDEPCTGGADAYLDLLLGRIIPKTISYINGIPSHMGIAGYSLAGLFSLYAAYNCSVFDCFASMSGSLWFPDFKEYVFSHDFFEKPRVIYISLGDDEANTENKYLSTVRSNTESIVSHYRKLGINVVYEINPGNHVSNVAVRSAKGIKALL